MSLVSMLVYLVKLLGLMALGLVLLVIIVSIIKTPFEVHKQKIAKKESQEEIDKICDELSNILINEFEKSLKKEEKPKKKTTKTKKDEK